ncbi:MAG: hypothetical protein N4A63_06400 [Vallitalea sp.]|nr:hypothetical protein [Vallitalea sp.]
MDEEATKQFLENCSSDEVYWISEIFEDIAYKFQSRKFICFLKELQRKYMKTYKMNFLSLAGEGLIEIN